MQEVLITVLTEKRGASMFQTVSFDFDRACAVMLDDYRHLSVQERAEITEMTAEEYRLELPEDYKDDRAAMLERDLHSGVVRAKGFRDRVDFLEEACVRRRDLLAEQ
ncbi:MAG: hypothetical protein IKD72_05690 [Clostridia bacterium]|nr:hypothetical protein [Clostridia bacterium]